ncbi:DNA primase [Streptomyces sp. NPDC051561]|uniref:DNA primase n=1 Tax=Streptomyces sp. NPDC051561 TaxID=3365658 RepID=UPI0037A16ECE
MPTPTCGHCEQPLRITARRHAIYCAPRCRAAAQRARRSVPAELTRRPRWVRHTARKVPLTVGGSVASSTDSSTWSRHADAAASTAGVGSGFVLNGDGIVVLDLDHCIGPDGELAGWAQTILDATAGATWVEVSRSGDGLHIWGLGALPHGRRITLDGGGSVELYADGRYIAITGTTYGGTPRRLGDVQHLIDALL